MKPKSITVKLDHRELEVKKLPLGRYAELLSAIQELPKNVNGLDKMSTDEVLQQLPVLLSKSLPDMIGVLTIATDLKKEEVEEMGLDEAVRVVVAVVEVNNYREVFDNIKKVMARPSEEANQKKITG